MSNEFYTASGNPSTSAAGTSATMRAEFAAIEAGFAILPTLSGNGLKIVGINSGATAMVAVATTGSGSVVLATSPSLVTPTLGVATATSVNKMAITTPATSSTLAVADGKTFTASNTLTLSGTDGSTLNVGAGGTLGSAAFTASSAYANSGAATSSGLTMNTGKLLGRTNVSSGAIEEISAGSGLTLSGGTLTASAIGSTLYLASLPNRL